MTDDDCNPDLSCVGAEGESVCTKLCRPFSAQENSDCPTDQMCGTVSLPDTGTMQALGVCTTPDTSAGEGAPCSPDQLYCDDDDTICSENVTTTQYVCTRFCQVGVAASCFGGRVCTREGVTSPDPEPPWLGVCR